MELTLDRPLSKSTLHKLHQKGRLLVQQEHKCCCSAPSI